MKLYPDFDKLVKEKNKEVAFLQQIEKALSNLDGIYFIGTDTRIHILIEDLEKIDDEYSYGYLEAHHLPDSIDWPIPDSGIKIYFNYKFKEENKKKAFNRKRLNLFPKGDIIILEKYVMGLFEQILTWHDTE